MNPDNPFATVAQAVVTLVTLHGDLFVALGQHLFRGFAVILIAWFGIQAALAASEGRGPFPMAKFAGLLMTIAFGYAMITYYTTPIPGFGVSFTHLVTDQAHALAQQLEASQAQEIDARLTELYLTMEQPSLLNTLDLIRYYLIVFTLTGARAALLAVIAFGWAATGVAVLVGPIFVPFFIVPQLEWLFWGWLKAFLQYAFYQVVAQAFVYVFGNLLLHFLDMYQPPFTVDRLTVAGLHLVFLLLAFIYGLLKVPSLVNSLFTGRSGESVVSSIIG
jgi:TrbL/VirB6 plasmid conjugal transfer protein